jgi:uncharacterized protein YfaS (alpha-2-macroglobulin family)
MAAAGSAQAVRVSAVSPAGADLADVGQVSLRFDAPVVAAGDPRAAAPARLLCQAGSGAAATPPGSGRWLDAQRWLYQLNEPLPAATRCTLSITPGFVPADGKPLEGATEWRFATGAPRVTRTLPGAGAQVEEDQHFLLRFNGPADAANATRRAWCEVEGLGERIGVKVIDGALREAVLKARLRYDAQGAATGWSAWLLLACQRPFPAEAGVRLVWGPGAGVPETQRFEFRVRERFAAEFSCERENAQSACLPLRPMSVRFNAAVPRAAALAVRLVPAAGSSGGAAIPPRTPREGEGDTLREIAFAAPLPENARFTVVLPPGLKDEAGRELSNAGAFPLAVATGAMPPLAKFPGGAAFGMLEAPVGQGDEPALLPITLRQVQADIAGAATGGSVRVLRLDAATPDATLLQWLARIERFHDGELSAQAAGLPQAMWTERVTETDARGRPRTVSRERQVQTRTLSLLSNEASARKLALPPPAATAAAETRATEVLGLPLAGHGLHVVEVESRVLGHALLEPKAPMYVRTGALVTPIAVHFKRGRSSSLAWVTTLDRARPVPGARVVVNDCTGKPLWSGSTDASGIARIERGFDEAYGKPCVSEHGLFVTARDAAGPNQSLAFVFSRWNKGIESWRFGLESSASTTPDRRAHTVFDRTLLRVGETVSMKHFVRVETERGLALPEPESLPDRLLITHQGSGAEVALPLAWPRGARSAESRWAIPKTAALGAYDVALVRGDKRLAAGSFRVEAFRVPLVDARLAAPAGDAVAPAEIAFAAQLNAMAGGPMAGAPLTLSALLRPLSPRFPQHEGFVFDPPRKPGTGEDGDAQDAGRLVADKLQARTDAQGAARIVVPKLPTLEGPAEVTAELGFDDPNGEVQTVTQRVRLYPASLLVGLRAVQWAGTRGSARFSALVVDLRGRPVAGRTVEVSGRTQQTTSVRTRVVGGFYAYDNRRSSQELGVLCSGKSDAQGRLDCDVAFKAGGEVELVARVRDDAGRSAEAATTVWVTGDEPLWFEPDNDDRIDVLPEARQLEPGQTARLQVRMPFRSATALVTVEREGVLDAKVVQLSGRSPVVELPIPAAADGGWAPNVHVGVFVLRGRLREAPWWSFFTWGWKEPSSWWQAFRHESADFRAPTAMVDLAKPAFKFGVATLEVGRAAHRLDVSVAADRPADAAYAVRETVKATVRVAHAGKPLANTEVAFAAVDEGLLALMPNDSWNLLEAMLAPRPWGVETATAQSELIGRRHYGRKALPPGGGGGRNPTRELFDTLLLWRGTVALDANGQAQIDVPLNDSLTRFRLVAIADDGAGRFGTGSTSVRVSQDLQMLSGLPLAAREGDRVDVAFTLRNTTDRAMSVAATLAGRSDAAVADIGGLAAQTVQLAAGAASEVRWTVAVPEGATRIEWTAAASEVPGAATPKAAKPAGDRLKVVQPVSPVVPLRAWQGQLVQLDAAAPFSLPVAEPSGALPGRSRLVATLKPTLAGNGLPGVRRYFESYPYTCLEQKASRAIGLADARGWEALMADLPGYIDGDGLAQFFPPAPGDAPRGSDRLTAYLVAAAHEAGYAIPTPARDRLLAGLAAFVEGRTERRLPYAPRADLEARKLAALEALSRHGRAEPRMLGSLAWSPGAMALWPTASLVDAWRLLQRMANAPDRAARLEQVQRILRSRLVEGSSSLTLAANEAQDEWWWLMESGDTAAARLLLAAIDQPAWRDDAPRLLAGLLARQQRGAWRTTTGNVWGQLAVERFAQQFEKVAPAGRSSVGLGGVSRAVDWAATPAGAAAELPLAAGTLAARHDGAGRPWLAVQALAAVPLNAPLAAGYRITRSVTPVQAKAAGATSRGDVLRVRIEVEAASDMAWVVVNDPVPTGATLLGGGLQRDSAIATRGERRDAPTGAWLAFEERGADVFRAYYEWLPRGRHVVEYTVRLNSAGRFGLPPTRVEAMYAPETFGEVPNAALEVRP